MKRLVALAIAASTPAQALDCEGSPSFPAAQALGRQAVECARSEARGLESSKEAADLVATAAVSRCDARFVAYKEAIRLCGGSALARSVDTKTRALARTEAIEAVVSMRAR